MQLSRTVSVAAASIAALGALAATAAPAQAQTFGGNISNTWSISGAPAAGLDTITYPITVGTATKHVAGTYFAQQFTMAGGADGYTGLQPRPDSGGHPVLHGVFSSFTAGSTSTDANCTDGADGGAGVSCAVDFPATYGHTFDVTVTRSGSDTWTGTVTDTTTGTQVHIGTFAMPAGSGALKPSQAGFVEYYNVPSCDQQPKYDVTFGAPRSGALSGSTVFNEEYGDCGGYGNTTHTVVGNGVRITRGSVA